MKKFLQLVVLIMLAMYNAVQHVTGGTTLKKLIPTGVIEQGILGGFSGKVGPVVGGTWKGINYMRGYVVPANPNTTAQQTQRTKFASAVAYARQLLPSVLQPYWDPFTTQMSGFNSWIQENINLLDGSNLINDSNIVAKGSLEGSLITSCSLNTISDELTVDWSPTITGNGLGTDWAACVLIDKNTQQVVFETEMVQRTVGQLVMSTPDGLVAGDVFGYLFFWRGTGESFTVSDSDGSVVS